MQNEMASAARTNPPIAQAFQDLSNSITDLDACLKHLIDMIKPIVGPDLSEPIDPDKGMTLDASDLATSINHEADRIQDLKRSIKHTIMRIEL